MFKDKKSLKVTDIKCHPNKMHRLLISFELAGICVYSINKNRSLFTLELREDKDFHKGKCLAVEWYNQEEFVVGY